MTKFDSNIFTCTREIKSSTLTNTVICPPLGGRVMLFIKWLDVWRPLVDIVLKSETLIKQFSWLWPAAHAGGLYLYLLFWLKNNDNENIHVYFLSLATKSIKIVKMSVNLSNESCVLWSYWLINLIYLFIYLFNLTII